ncbi:MAG: flippase-like domain-containing protein [Rhodocyclaceae bacterium]|nr:flippase-like domain-containing protein [Rhodocyclaceae bacterium]
MRSLFRISCSLALVALVIALVGPQRVLAAFATADPRWLGAGLGAAILATLLSAGRWHALAAWLGADAPYGAMLTAYWRGITTNTVLPGGHLGGDAMRALHLQRRGHPLGVAAASVVLDRFSGLWMLMAISLAGTALAQALHILPAGLLRWPAALTALLAAAVLAAPLLLWQISTRLARWLPAKLASALAIVHQRPQPLRLYFGQMLWSAAVQGLSILAFVSGARAVGLDLSLAEFAAAAGPIFILAALPVSIGGWGTREAAAAVTLAPLGAPHELAVAAAVIYGLFAALQGLAGAFTFLHAKSDAAADSNSGENHAR